MTTPGADAPTIADVLRPLAEVDTPALYFGDSTWSYRQLLAEAGRRAALFDELRDRDRPPHIGVLLDNVPDYLFWLAAAALSGAVVVGINSTYRGDQLGHADPAHRLPAARDLQPTIADCSTVSTPGVADDRVLAGRRPESPPTDRRRSPPSFRRPRSPRTTSSC